MNKKPWWEDCLKEAEAAGFHHHDIHDVPLKSGGSIHLVHTNGITHIWQIKEGWQVAEYIDGRAQNHRPHENLTDALKDTPKTLKDWQDSKKNLTDFIKVGDAVTLDIIDDMAGCVPPKVFFSKKYRSGDVQGCLQVGETYSHDSSGTPLYMTFFRKVDLTKRGDCWRYAGIQKEYLEGVAV